MGFPTEGESGDRRRIGSILQPAASVASDATIADVAATESRHMVAVLGCEGVLVGGVPDEARDLPPDTPVERIMVPAPPTIRPDLRIGEAASRLRKDHTDSIFVTTA